MANTAALLLNLLNTNADINYYTQQSIYWSAKYEANNAKLTKQVNYEESWMKEYDKAKDGTRTTELKINGVQQVAANTEATDCQAIAWADYKVDEYDEELSQELADLDMEYDTMKTMYDSMLEQLRAQQETEKTATSNAAQDTGLLQS